tara:strand:- start:67 stop:303 length:237 start_codon:yes stop_codon:yes gene_type:complete
MTRTTAIVTAATAVSPLTIVQNERTALMTFPTYAETLEAFKNLPHGRWDEGSAFAIIDATGAEVMERETIALQLGLES